MAETANGPHPGALHLGTLPTLEAVAAIAGVSKSTVSRVINDSTVVSADAKARVEAAIAELGYAPNRAARSLARRRSDSLAVIVHESDATLFSDPFFGRIVRSISQALANSEVQLVLLLAQTDADCARVERYVRQGHSDGVLLVSAHGDDPLAIALATAEVPTIMAGRPLFDASLPYVDSDNRTGARMAVEHLVQRGRGVIATVAGPADMSAGVDRLAGYRDGLRAAGANYRRSLVEYGDWTAESGHRAMRALLAREPAIDAVAVASDLMAVGALQALREADRDVPGQVAVVGFDDTPLWSWGYGAVPLTTVRQPVEQIGTEMTSRLRDYLEGRAPTIDSVTLPTELIVRQTT
ncbi:MAG TPA: LacI family DNA-binding transcriptional regulator [Pseudonocardiaceae bacterium]|nr:LacI family DNA-binding transcriptional regulator [Pseudonocardiaceae bacterium]